MKHKNNNHSYNSIFDLISGDAFRYVILRRTKDGLNIYSHILRQYYPEETILLSKKTSQPCKNPFNNDKPTLHIFTYPIKNQKIKMIAPIINRKSSLINRFAMHTDAENAIPAGDCFDFAALHYNQTDMDLWKTITNELLTKSNIHISC